MLSSASKAVRLAAMKAAMSSVLAYALTISIAFLAASDFERGTVIVTASSCELQISVSLQACSSSSLGESLMQDSSYDIERIIFAINAESSIRNVTIKIKMSADIIVFFIYNIPLRSCTTIFVAQDQFFVTHIVDCENEYVLDMAAARS